MSIKINDLTVTFKNKVTAINHADLEIPNGVLDSWEKTGRKTTLMSSYHCPYPDQWYGKYGRNSFIVKLPENPAQDWLSSAGN